MEGVDVAGLPLEDLLGREWLSVNGTGAFACSTVPSLNTRKYHGLLVAAMAPPVRQMVLLSRVEETVVCGGTTTALASSEYPESIHPSGYRHLCAFEAYPYPRWAYQRQPWTIEKSLRLLDGQNAVCLSYTLLGAAEPVTLEMRPMLALRGIHELMYQWNGPLRVETRGGTRHRIAPTSRTPEVFFTHDGEFIEQAHWYLNTIYRHEQRRGYAGLEDVWTPGVVRWRLEPGRSVHFVCAADPVELESVEAELRRQTAQAHVVGGGVVAEAPDRTMELLVRAGRQFVGRDRENRVRILTGYPWAAVCGRDALIAMPGLLLVTGRVEEALSLLELFAGHVKQGLMPSEWPIDGSAPRYTSVDCSLWFVHAVQEYLRYGGDERAVRLGLWDVVDGIIGHYRHGTGLGVGCDDEGLLSSHQVNTATTWMDAKVGDWVVTPRQGRAVEVNALWYNALCAAGDLAIRFGIGSRADELKAAAQHVRGAFNRRFWNEKGGCCFDVVEDHGSDPSVRPNQLLAVSLPHAVLAMEHHAAVLKKVRQELLTPMGVRTLSPQDPNYHGHYGGGIVERDRAHHQGSVHPWLLGPLVTAHVKVHGRGAEARAECRDLLEGCLAYMRGAGTGQLCELFDGGEPYGPGGLTASARSVGELLRCYAEDVLDQAPADAGKASRSGGRAPPVRKAPAR